MIEFLVTTLVSCLAASVLTPWIRMAAHKFGLVDHPDGRRKLHLKPIALGGGVAVFFAALIGLLCVGLAFPGLLGITQASQVVFFCGLLGASLFIVGVGLVDDRYHLRGR